jgi:4'-phosphopantetheinyl transferase
MIDLWYLNTKRIMLEDFRVLVKSLPQEIVIEIMRFKDLGDKRLKLFGKLMVEKYCTDLDIGFKWGEWQVSSSGKPYYRGRKKFNISHSGDYVIVAFSDQEIGTDIERIMDFDIMSAVSYLHPDEVEYIKRSLDPKDAFFEIWTRKEAYLKAIGKGIIEGLNNENCFLDEIIHNEKWFLHSLSLISNYKIAVCTQVPNCQIATRELFPFEFKTNTINIKSEDSQLTKK